MQEDKKIPISSSQLINYAYGLLSPEESGKIKTAIEQDESLQWEYEGIVRIIRDFPDEDPEDVLGRMAVNVQDKVHRLLEQNKKKSRKVFFLQKPFLIAASVLAFILAGVLIYRQTAIRDPQVFAQQILDRPYSDPYITRGVNTSALPRWEVDFKAHAYHEAIRKLAALPDSSLTGREEFYFGLAYLKSKPAQPGRAEVHLLKSIAAHNKYEGEAWHYLAIAQILDKNPNGAESSLSHSTRIPQADSLLRLLKK